MKVEYNVEQEPLKICRYYRGIKMLSHTMKEWEREWRWGEKSVSIFEN